MKNLLYLVHRLPYPPNKGDKITSFNLLKYLSRYRNIYLGCFVDDPKDWHYVQKLESYCTELFPVSLNPRIAKIRSVSGFLTGEALSLPYYRNSELQNWVDGVMVSERIDDIFILSGAMAQYVTHHLDSSKKSILDLEDVDSDKWQLFAKNHGWPLNWIFRRESRKLLSFERDMARKFDVTLFVSRMEAQLFQKPVGLFQDLFIEKPGILFISFSEVVFPFFECDQFELVSQFMCSSLEQFDAVIEHRAIVSAVEGNCRR